MRYPKVSAQVRTHCVAGTRQAPSRLATEARALYTTERTAAAQLNAAKSIHRAHAHPIEVSVMGAHHRKPVLLHAQLLENLLVHCRPPRVGPVRQQRTPSERRDIGRCCLLLGRLNVGGPPV